MLALARSSQRKSYDGITQGNNQQVLPWEVLPIPGRQNQWGLGGGLEGVGRGNGKLGREGPPCWRNLLAAAREIHLRSHTHTHTYGNTHTVDVALLPLMTGAASFFTHTHWANINTPTLCLICFTSTSSAKEARKPLSFLRNKLSIC